MSLMRLIYASTAENIDHDDIKDILESCKRNNKELSISGMLCFNSKFFLQYLEGSRENINITYNKILRDPRHSHSVMIDYSPISQRVFPQWEMNYVGENKINDKLFFTFSEEHVFDPYMMSEEAAMGLLKALAKETT